MFCQRCNYPLRELNASACPECNQAFCATDSSTFHQKLGTSTLLENTLIWCIGLVLLPWCLAVGCACVASVILGHWPRPMQDDPKGIAVVSFIQPVYLISFLVAFVAWCTLIGMAIVMAKLAYSERSRRAATFAAAAVVSVIVGAGIARIDPLAILNWMND